MLGKRASFTPGIKSCERLTPFSKRRLSWNLVTSFSLFSDYIKKHSELIDSLYSDDSYGSSIFISMQSARHAIDAQQSSLLHYHKRILDASTSAAESLRAFRNKYKEKLFYIHTGFRSVRLSYNAALEKLASCKKDLVKRYTAHIHVYRCIYNSNIIQICKGCRE